MIETRVFFGGLAIVLAVVMALNLVGGRIVASLIEIDRQSKPIFFWSMIGLQEVMAIMFALTAIFGSPGTSGLPQ